MKIIMQKQQNVGIVANALEERMAMMQSQQGAPGRSGGAPSGAVSYASAAAAAAGR